MSIHPALATQPASLAQKAIWLFCQLEENSHAYHLSTSFRLSGAWSICLLERSLQHLVKEHKALRSALLQQGDQLYFKVMPALERQLVCLDLCDLSEQEFLQVALDLAQVPFDLALGEPIRFHLLIRPSGYLLFWVVHHCNFDGVSSAILVEDLCSIYEKLARKLLAPSLIRSCYADFIQWQQQFLLSKEGARMRAWWLNQLSGCKAEIHFPMSAPGNLPASGARVIDKLRLSGCVGLQLKALARRHHISIFTVFLSSFFLVLQYFSKQNDLVVVSPMSGRPEARFEKVVGLFVNMIAWRLKIRPTLTVGQLLRQAGDMVMDALEHGYYPFSEVVECLDLDCGAARLSSFQSCFVYQNWVREKQGHFVMPDQGMLELHPLDLVHELGGHHLTLEIFSLGDEQLVFWKYDPSRFSRSFMVKMQEQWLYLIKSMSQAGDNPLSDLFPAIESPQLLQHLTLPAPVQHPSSFRFLAIAEGAEGNVALEHCDQQLCFAELDRRSTLLAAALRCRGAKTEVVVGIWAVRSIDFIVAVFAVLKAGATFLCLDPASPDSRLEAILCDADVRLVVAPAEANKRRCLKGIQHVLPQAENLSGYTATNYSAPAEASAYVVYTSGSTGNPKGIIISYGALACFVNAALAQYRLNGQDRVLQFSSLCFDTAIEEICTSLAVGATLVLRTEEMLSDLVFFVAEVDRLKISVLDLPTAFWHQLVDGGQGKLPERVRLLIIGGEQAGSHQLERHLQLNGSNGTLLNTYGPSETTVAVCSWLGSDAWLNDAQNKIVPIGTPLGQAEIHILDAHLQRVASGDEGELSVGGPVLARGYLMQAAQTAQSFVPDPFSNQPGSRLYRTGDLARLQSSPDGAVHCYLGRLDQQLKLRGFRIEPGEIESCIQQVDGLGASVVRLRQQDRSEDRLVAWYTTSGQKRVAEHTLKDHLTQNLPAYMVPTAFVLLAALPLNERGKLAESELPDPQWKKDGLQHQTARQLGFVEKLLSEIWSEVLTQNQLGLHDNFFDLGGHSLLATQVSTRIRRVFRRHLPLAEFFNHPTIAEQATFIRQQRESIRHKRPMVVVSRAGRLPISPGQQRLWFLEQLSHTGAGYVVSVAVTMTGPLRLNLFERALLDLIARHEPLRTRFQTDSISGLPFQFITEHSTLALAVIDLRGLTENQKQATTKQLAREGGCRSFDLAKAPLVRASVLWLDEGRAQLQLNLHHLICDAWSIDIILREWGLFYEARCLGIPVQLKPLPLQFADYACWYQDHRACFEEQRSWWATQLRGSQDVLPLPLDFPRPSVHRSQGRTLRFEIKAQLRQALADLSRDAGVTMFTTMLTAFKVLLARYSGCDDLLVGTPVTHREGVAMEQMVGFFVNSLILRTRLPSGEGPSFESLVDVVHQTALDAYAHQDVPFELLVEDLQPERKLACNPLFQVTFQYLYMPPTTEVSEVTFAGIDMDYSLSRFDLSLLLGQRNEDLFGQLEYNSELFRPERIAAIAQHYCNLLGAIVAAPTQPVKRLTLMDQAERQRVLYDWNQTRSPNPARSNIAQIFESCAEEYAQRDAIWYRNSRLNYAELNGQANQLASQLLRQGVRPGDRVGICLRSCPRLVIALLAVVKLGATYVAMEPDYPKERLTFILKDASLRLVLCIDPQIFCDLHGVTALVIAEENDSLPQANPERDNNAHGSAYVTYTSGSTGKPKGVVISHQAVLRLVFDHHYLKLLPSDRVAQAANPAFDALTFEVWTPLLQGNGLVMIEKHTFLQPQQLAAQIEAQSITVIFMTTAVFNQCAREQPQMFAKMRYVLFGGERVDTAMVSRVTKQGPPEHLLHVYGPTESTTFATWFEVHDVPAEAKNLAIGTPIAGTTSYVLSPLKEPVPPGVVGELCLGGVGLAEGYLTRPALTATSFVPDPFARTAGSRLYCTGDLVRHDRNGPALVFLGRLDHQVKIRGYRVEPGEVEAQARNCPGMTDIFVATRVHSEEELYLAAWYVGSNLGASELRCYLEEHLPSYLIPSALVEMERLPLNANGKVDGGSLPDPELYRQDDSRDMVLPRNTLEATILTVWSQLLSCQEISVDDNLFKLGAHSLLLSRAATRLWDRLGLNLPIDVLFEHPTVAEQAQYIDIVHWSSQAKGNDGDYEEEGRI